MKFSYQEAGGGRPLIFLHGIGGNADTWRYQLEAFADEYRVIALDLPGYGRSDLLPHTTFPALAQWLHEFIVTHQLENPILVGNSFGGMIVQEYLAAYGGGGLTAVVLYGTSPAFGRKDGKWQQKFIRARLQPLDDGQTMAELAPTIVKGLVGSGATAAGIELARQGVAAVAEETFRTAVMTLVQFDQRANLGNIHLPCLLLVGEEDSNAPPPMMEKMATYIPHAQFVCLPQLGHLAHVENPQLFNDALHLFLESVNQ